MSHNFQLVLVLKNSPWKVILSSNTFVLAQVVWSSRNLSRVGSLLESSKVWCCQVRKGSAKPVTQPEKAIPGNVKALFELYLNLLSLKFYFLFFSYGIQNRKMLKRQANPLSISFVLSQSIRLKRFLKRQVIRIRKSGTTSRERSGRTLTHGANKRRYVNDGTS